MNNTRENETLYQNIAVELDDEALANVIGGSYSGNDCYDNRNLCQEELERQRCHRGLVEGLLSYLL